MWYIPTDWQRSEIIYQEVSADRKHAVFGDNSKENFCIPFVLENFI